MSSERGLKDELVKAVRKGSITRMDALTILHLGEKDERVEDGFAYFCVGMLIVMVIAVMYFMR